MANVRDNHKETKQTGKSVDVALIFRHHGQEYLKDNRLSWEQKDIMKAIMTCRTRFLGGHREQCDHCSYSRNVFISCRNRHCPTCQATVKAKWIQDRKEELLPVPYFHLVFTISHDINPIALFNKRVIGNILFRAVSRTLLEFGSNTKNRLGGKIGFLAILHTWDQKLLTHFHIHCVLPAGALSNDGTHWVDLGKNYLFPVKALSAVFRGKFMAYLKQAYKDGKLSLPGKKEQDGQKEEFDKLTETLWKKKWVVYAKPVLNHPEKVLEYLGRYVHRVAIANHRIIEMDPKTVTFTYKDRKNKTDKNMKLPAREFIRRFMLHTLPKQFRRIRSYGYLANRSKKKDLNRCRELLGALPDPATPKKSTVELVCEMLGIDITKCPQCKRGTMHVVEKIVPLMQDITIDDLFNYPCWDDTS